MAKLLLVEDDPVISRTLAISLPLRGLQLETSGTLAEAKQKLAKSSFDLVILDVDLPDGLGFDLCQELRLTQPHLPILMLTARTDEESAVEGITVGADDYIRKPFGLEELVARIRRRLQRDINQDHIITYGNLKVNLQTRIIMVKDKQLSLSKKEFDILVILVKKSGQDVAREQLMAAIDEEGKIYDRTLDSHVSHLRQRFKETEANLQIVSVYGVGYRLETL